MLQRSIVITNTLGLHARAAAKLARIAGRFSSSVRLGRDGRVVDAKSLLGLLVLSASTGTTVDVVVDGPDEQAAMAAIVELIEHKFDEHDG